MDYEDWHAELQSWMEDGDERYAAFGLRIRQLFQVKLAGASKAMRYAAYASDVGEAFRPVVSRTLVNASYAVAIAYIMGDVAHTSWVESKKPDGNVPRAAVHAALFQGSASLLLPAVIIHQAVHVTRHVTKRVGRFTRWGPTLTGLAIIPLLPVMLDEPCEHAVDSVIDYCWPVALTSSTADAGSSSLTSASAAQHAAAHALSASHSMSTQVSAGAHGGTSFARLILGSSGAESDGAAEKHVSSEHALQSGLSASVHAGNRIPGALSVSEARR